MRNAIETIREKFIHRLAENSNKYGKGSLVLEEDFEILYALNELVKLAMEKEKNI